MLLNTMLYSYANEGEEYANDFKYDDNPLKVKQPVSKSAVNDTIDLTYIRWEVFDEIPELAYTIQFDGYVDKKRQPLNDWISIKHLTNGEYVNYDNDYYIKITWTIINMI